MPAVSSTRRASLRSQKRAIAAALSVTTSRPIPSDQPPEAYLTRREATDFINSVLGRPLSFSTATTLASRGEFAQPTVWWGRRPLYTRENLCAWVESRERRQSPAREGTA